MAGLLTFNPVYHCMFQNSIKVENDLNLTVHVQHFHDFGYFDQKYTALKNYSHNPNNCNQCRFRRCTLVINVLSRLDVIGYKYDGDSQCSERRIIVYH